MGKRKAIYRPFAPGHPQRAVIDKEHCSFFLKGKCKACEKACRTGAIDFTQQDEMLDLEVGNHRRRHRL